MQNAMIVMLGAFMLVQLWKLVMGGRYACPQCGSKNGEHSPTCSFRR